MQSRRTFLLQSALTAPSLIYFDRFSKVKSKILFDLHAHPGRFYAKGSPEMGSPSNTMADMKTASLDGAFFSLVSDLKLLSIGQTGVIAKGTYGTGEAWKEYQRQLQDLKYFFQLAGIAQKTKADELRKNELAGFISVEGGDFLEGSLEKIYDAYHDGVRSIQLVHYAPNGVADLQTMPPVHMGLSSFGREVVKEMNKIGMLIDVAHASIDTVRQVVDNTTKPIMLSHSILSMEQDRPIAIRSISKEHARLIASTGGIIGAWPSGFNKSFEEFVDNIKRLIDTVGVNHVGIGTDMDSNFKPVLDNYNQFKSLADTLQSKGLSSNEVNKVLGGNAYRVLKNTIG